MNRKHLFLIAPLALLFLGGGILFYNYATPPSAAPHPLTEGQETPSSATNQYKERAQVGRGVESDSWFLVGNKITSEDHEQFENWAESLSRSPEEKDLRLHHLKHMKRAEVVAFRTISHNIDRFEPAHFPLELEIPLFDGEHETVRFDHLDADSNQGGIISGWMAEDPSVSVLFGYHNGETSGIVEAGDRLIYYDAFDGEVMIVRELDSKSYHADFQCQAVPSPKHHPHLMHPENKSSERAQDL